MKIYNKIFFLFLILLMGLCVAQSASAAKTLSLTNNISLNNTGDDAARTALMDINLEGANDVNGVVFTLVYDPEIFTFEGLLKGDMDIDDGSGYDPQNPPSAETIANTLYYQVNNKADKGIAMIAAASANFFTGSETIPFKLFKIKFKVKSGKGNGNYPIKIQKTIIGPDTAANAGYTVPTSLAVAAGLAPNESPEHARTYEVVFNPGLIQISGGYKVSGTVVYGTTPETNANNCTAKLIKVSSFADSKIAEQTIQNGAYSFTDISNGTYKIEILANRSGFQKRYISGAFDVNGADHTLPKIILAGYHPVSGKITMNGSTDNISGLKIEIRDQNTGQIIATASVDKDGNFVTPPVENPLPASARIYAVYGSQEKDITNNISSPYNWTLALGTVSGTISGLCNSQLVQVLITSDSAKLRKFLMITGDGSDKTYTFNNLVPANDYILSVVGDGFAIFYDGTENFTDAKAVAVQADTDTSGKNFTLNCGNLKTVSGKVTIDGSAIKEVTVKANNFDFTTWKFSSAQTDSQGNFEIQLAPSDDYYIYIEHKGLRYYYKAGGNAVTSRSDASKVNVSATSATGINIPVVIPIPNTAKLEGYVTLNRSKNDNGTPLENYLVVLLNEQNIPVGVLARTNSDGYYLFENLPPGTYNVSLITPAPYAIQINKGLILSNDTKERSDFIVDQNFRVTGVVKDADTGLFIGSARVNILKSDGSIFRKPAYTNNQGLYSLYDIPSGVYTLAANHKDYFPAEKTNVQVISDYTADDILMTKGAIISGVVSDENGPINNAIVTLRGLNYAKATNTNIKGEYEFKGLTPNSPHMIKAAKGMDYIPYEPDDIESGVSGSNTTHNMTLVIPVTTWTFGGTVTEAGSPVNNAYVLLYSSDTQYRKVVKTDSTGSFIFYKVIDGNNYSLLVLPGDKKPEILQTNISIKANNTGYNVQVPTIATIQGTITLSEPDANAIVIAGAYDSSAKVVHEVQAVNSGDNQTFNYSIKVKAGIDYKVFAQDLIGAFAIKYYASDLADTSGAYTQSTSVQNDKNNINIKLSK